METISRHNYLNYLYNIRTLKNSRSGSIKLEYAASGLRKSAKIGTYIAAKRAAAEKFNRDCRAKKIARPVRVKALSNRQSG